MHASPKAHRTATTWLVAIVGSIALALATPAPGHAEEANPNNYTCKGQVSVGAPEVGSEEQQVQYVFSCNGPITGYQLQSQIPLTGIQAAPVVTNVEAAPLGDTFSCSGEFPGYAENCVGQTKTGEEFITGQFAIGTKLCTEPRADPLLTVTYAYLEKGVVTQAISGPFDLGRPKGCRADAASRFDRLDPPPPAKHKKKAGHKKRAGKKGHQKRKGR